MDLGVVWEGEMGKGKETGKDYIMCRFYSLRKCRRWIAERRERCLIPVIFSCEERCIVPHSFIPLVVCECLTAFGSPAFLDDPIHGRDIDMLSLRNLCLPREYSGSSCCN